MPDPVCAVEAAPGVLLHYPEESEPFCCGTFPIFNCIPSKILVIDL